MHIWPTLFVVLPTHTHTQQACSFPNNDHKSSDSGPQKFGFSSHASEDGAHERKSRLPARPWTPESSGL